MYILHTCLFVLLHSKIHHGKKRTKDMLAGTYSIPDTSLSFTSVLDLEGAKLICYLIYLLVFFFQKEEITICFTLYGIIRFLDLFWQF